MLQLSRERPHGQVNTEHFKAVFFLLYLFNQDSIRDCTGQKKGRDNSGLVCYNCQGSGHMARYFLVPF